VWHALLPRSTLVEAHHHLANPIAMLAEDTPGAGPFDFLAIGFENVLEVRGALIAAPSAQARGSTQVAHSAAIASLTGAGSKCGSPVEKLLSGRVQLCGPLWTYDRLSVLRHACTPQFLDGLLEKGGVPYSYGFSIILLTLLVKVATFPLTQKQVRACMHVGQVHVLSCSTQGRVTIHRVENTCAALGLHGYGKLAWMASRGTGCVCTTTRCRSNLRLPSKRCSRA
jgi:hypothetical protein